MTRPAAAQGTERPAARAAARPRVVVHLAHEQDPVAWRARYAAGETLDRTPYGYDLAAGAFDLAWSVSHRERPVVARVRRALAARLGTDVVHAWRNRALLGSADVVWTHTEREHLAVGLVRTTLPRRRRPAVLAQSVWLWDRWDDLGRARRRLFAAVLRGHAVEAVHSDVNRRVALDRVPGRRVVLVPFGTAPATGEGRAAGSAASAPEVLAVGNDRDRDWAVLRAALDLLPGVTARIASRSAAAARVAVPGRVDVAPAAGRAELARLYEGCRVVVVPLRENRHASGATACVEAMAAGRALVVTDAGGVRDYVVGTRARLVAPHDAAALADAVRHALGPGEATSAADVRARGLRQEDYVARYVLLTCALLAQAEIPAAVSSFEPVAEEAGLAP
ncbi:Glycosyltransferase involved in cell wall bisynthesis [Cellulosimicrobium cellulans]|nr:Glycosyltransferase involved in cell wall bisynthesis [Cellulosimicrobium cellulans]